MRDLNNGGIEIRFFQTNPILIKLISVLLLSNGYVLILIFMINVQ